MKGCIFVCLDLSGRRMFEFSLDLENEDGTGAGRTSFYRLKQGASRMHALPAPLPLKLHQPSTLSVAGRSPEMNLSTLVLVSRGLKLKIRRSAM